MAFSAKVAALKFSPEKAKKISFCYFSAVDGYFIGL
jgi:hypothetical protein